MTVEELYCIHCGETERFSLWVHDMTMTINPKNTELLSINDDEEVRCDGCFRWSGLYSLMMRYSNGYSRVEEDLIETKDMIKILTGEID